MAQRITPASPTVVPPRPEDATLAARNALIGMIDYMVREHHLTPEQAYVVASVAADLRISQVVDEPNFIVSAFLPLEIFTGGE